MIVYNNFLPFKGYVAMAIFPFIFIRKEYKEMKSIHKKVVINHEKIHFQQQKELLFIGFYLIYLFIYLYNRLIKKQKHDKAYRQIIFEREAYKNQGNFNYLQQRKRYHYV